MIASALVSLLLLVHLSTPLMAAVPAAEHHDIVFHIERPGVPVPDYTIDVNENGTGKYWEGPPSAADGDVHKPPVSITVTAATLAKIFAVKLLIAPATCDSHIKNIANTGKKTLTYQDNDQEVSCVFNYSEDEKITAAVSAFQAMAQALQMNDKLKHDHRFDHLGLDADLDGLTAAVKSGYAIELQNIAPTLQSIVDDEEMMSPVRRKATALLQISKIQLPSAR